MLGRDSCCAEGEAFGEAGLLNKPCGGDFDANQVLVAGAGRKPRRRASGTACGDALEEILRDYRVLEEAAGAATVGVAIDDEHALALANPADGGGNVFERGLAPLRK